MLVLRAGIPLNGFGDMKIQTTAQEIGAYREEYWVGMQEAKREIEKARALHSIDGLRQLWRTDLACDVLEWLVQQVK